MTSETRYLPLTRTLVTSHWIIRDGLVLRVGFDGIERQSAHSPGGLEKLVQAGTLLKVEHHGD